MGKLEVKLRDKYPNEFVTTMAGAIIRKGTWTQVDEDDFEVRHFLATDTVLEVRGNDTMREKIIIDTPQAATLKEVVGKEAMTSNEKVTRKKKTEDAESSDQPE